MDDILWMLKKIKSFTDLEPLVYVEGRPSPSFFNQNQELFLASTSADQRTAFFKYLEFLTFANYLEKVRFLQVTVFLNGIAMYHR